MFLFDLKENISTKVLGFYIWSFFKDWIRFRPAHPDPARRKNKKCKQHGDIRMFRNLQAHEIKKQDIDEYKRLYYDKEGKNIGES